MHRTSQEVAVQAIIFGALGFRASLEVTDHPRCERLCSQLIPWLDKLCHAVPIQEFHREILATPHRHLPREFQVEAFWRGEAACFMGWAIHLFDKPGATTFVDPGLLVRNLRILQPDVAQLISSVRLRPQIEIGEYCAFCLTLRHQFLLVTIPQEAQATLSRIHQAKLAELGLSEAVRRVNVPEVAAAFNQSATGMKGLYVVRGLAAEWLLGNEGDP